MLLAKFGVGFVALFVLSTTPVTTKSQQRLPIAPIRSLSPPNSSASFLLVRLRTRQADIIRLRVRVLRHALDPGQQPSWANGDQIENNAFAHRHQNNTSSKTRCQMLRCPACPGKLERLLVAAFGEAALNG